MGEPDRSEVTRILEAMSAGDRSGIDRLLPLLYEDLRRLAQAQFVHERPGHTLQATVLVHEAYVRLANVSKVKWAGRAHFLGAAASTIRRILIDHARMRDREKRGGKIPHVRLDTGQLLPTRPVTDVLALDEAIEALAALNETHARIVEMRVFGGMTNPEVAEALGMKLRTLEGEWSMAKQWLRRRMERERDE